MYVARCKRERGRRSISSLTSQATTCRRLDLSRPIIERKQFINRPCASKQIDRIAPDRAKTLLPFRAFSRLRVFGVSQTRSAFQNGGQFEPPKYKTDYVKEEIRESRTNKFAISSNKFKFSGQFCVSVFSFLQIINSVSHLEQLISLGLRGVPSCGT